MPSGASTLESKVSLPAATVPVQPPPIRRPELRRSLPGAAARRLAQILSTAEIEINGSRPWDLQVRNDRLYERLLYGGSLGVGESYVDGWWDAEKLDEFFTRVFQHVDTDAAFSSLAARWQAFAARLFNRQTRRRAIQVERLHYDLGIDIYLRMLDHRMQYSCAYWKDASTLDEAQENKLRLTCDKLNLSPGMTVLELGGGFGGLAHMLAADYGCDVVSYNLSRDQVNWARSICQGLNVRVEAKDYREASREPAQFDRVVSVGLCEHVGPKNYRAFLDLVHGRLKAGGLFLLHTIGGNRSVTTTDPWIDRYIFPNGVIPSAQQLTAAMEGKWVVEDWHNFGPDYDRTLVAWWSNLRAAWTCLQEKYDERFRRTWQYYLLSTAGAFRARKLQLWQAVLSKGDVQRYTPIR